MTLSGRGLVFGGLLLLAVSGALLHFEFGYSYPDQPGHAYGSDDAYISYRYAQNLVNGNGLVFNAGERVEGYTNLLYTLIAAIFVRLDPESVYADCFAFNIFCYAATLLLFYWYLRRHVDGRGAMAGAFTLSACPLMWAWPASGLETSAVLLVQLALFVTAVECARKPRSMVVVIYCCLSGASIFLRADGFIFPILCCSAFLLKRQYKHLAIAATVIVVLSGIYVGARYWYYGAALPNSFYAKVSGPLVKRLLAAGRELARLAIKDAFLIYLLPLALGWGESLRRVRLEGARGLSSLPLVPVIGAGLLGYWAWIGGDVFNERFLLVLIPLSLFHMVALGGFMSKGNRAVAIFLTMAVLQFTPFVFDGRFAYRGQKYDLWTDLGKYLRRTHPNATLAIDAAGKVPYYSRLNTIDMLGLNNRHIGGERATPFRFIVGHNKTDPDYVLARKPDLIAAWSFRNLDLYWGLNKTKYLSNGYVWKYVVNSSLNSRPQNIIDVSRMTEAEIRKLVATDYRYVLIQRVNAQGG